MGKGKYLKLEQDRLWGDHYWQTREVIRDAASNSPCLNVDVKSLFKNQVYLGRNFYKLTRNKTAGKHLAKELTIHIEIALEIVTLAIKGKSIDKAYKRWQENGRDVAKVYHKYHPKIEFHEMNRHMQTHLSTTLAEAVAIIQGTCEESYIAGKVALEHIRTMSSYINSKF